MRNRLMPLLFGAAFALSLLLVWRLATDMRTLRASARTERQRAKLPLAGKYLPPLAMRTLAGDSVVLAGDGSGDTQLLLYYTAGCGFCKDEAAEWKRFASRWSSDSSGGVRIIGVSLDTTDREAQAFATAHALPFPIVRIHEPRWRALYLGVAVPSTVVVGGDGRIVFARNGPLTRDSGVDSLSQALSKTVAGRDSLQ